MKVKEALELEQNSKNGNEERISGYQFISSKILQGANRTCRIFWIIIELKADKTKRLTKEQENG